jgi:hypothetical protein
METPGEEQYIMSEWVDDLARDLSRGESGHRGAARRTRRGVLARLLGAAIAASPLVLADAMPSAAGKKCKKNNDCGSNKRCRHGECEPKGDGDGGGGGGGRSELSAERLRNSDANQIEERAKNNDDFNQIREYFAHEDGRDWNQIGGDAFRISKNGNRVRDAFWITSRNPKGDQWVHVMFGREDNGKESAVGLLWRGDGNKGRYSNVFYVQNGHIRNDDGRVDGADARAQSIPWPDNLDQLVCPVLAKGPCYVGTAVTAAACMVPGAGIPECVGGGMVVTFCFDISDTSEAECKKVDGS